MRYFSNRQNYQAADGAGQQDSSTRGPRMNGSESKPWVTDLRPASTAKSLFNIEINLRWNQTRQAKSIDIFRSQPMSTHQSLLHHYISTQSTQDGPRPSSNSHSFLSQLHTTTLHIFWDYGINKICPQTDRQSADGEHMKNKKKIKSTHFSLLLLNLATLFIFFLVKRSISGRETPPDWYDFSDKWIIRHSSRDSIAGYEWFSSLSVCKSLSTQWAVSH